MSMIGIGLSTTRSYGHLAQRLGVHFLLLEKTDFLFLESNYKIMLESALGGFLLLEIPNFLLLESNQDRIIL